MNKIIRNSSCVSVNSEQNILSLHAGMNWDSKAKGSIVDISQESTPLKNGQWLHARDLHFMLTSKIFIESKKQEKKKNWVGNL